MKDRIALSVRVCVSVVVGLSAAASAVPNPVTPAEAQQLAQRDVIVILRDQLANAPAERRAMSGRATAIAASQTPLVAQLQQSRARNVTSTSTKSMTGHMLGAAGAVEAIASVLAIVHGVVPPTINVTDLDPACDLTYALNKPVYREVRVALSNAFGFGGHNTCAAFVALDNG